ncbi:MAG TPA: mechanosensitive ion channel domain-containing protein [Arenibaculum sp.]|nr:mechanosensitive ion channel domain-containing protein [Arenibaculum sp.]
MRPWAASAQEVPAATPAPQVEVQDLRDLLTTIEDPVARERLATQIRTLIETREVAEPPELEALGASTLQFLSERIATLSRQMVAIGSAFRDLPVALDWVGRQITDEASRERWTELAIQLVGAILAGFLAGWVTRYLLRSIRSSIGRYPPETLVARIPLLFARMLLDLIPVVAFALGGYGLLSITDPPRAIRLAALVVINAHILIGVVLLVTRSVLAPGTPPLRPLPIGDETAYYSYIWVRRIAFTSIYGYLIGETAFLLGLPQSAYAALLKLVGLIVTAMLVILVLQNRANVARWLRGHPVSGGANGGMEAAEVAQGRRSGALRTVRRRIADIWHVLAILYIVFSYAILALGIEGGFEFMVRATIASIVIFVVARLVVTVLDRAVRRGFAIPPDLKARYPLLEERANRYLPILDRALKAVIWLIALLGLLDAWGVDSFAWLDTPFGANFVSSTITIALVLVIAVIAWELVSNVIERYLAGNGRDGTRVERSARVRTLLPLLRNAFLVLLVVVVGLVLLSELGLDIAPLLAGAGVIGLAIGFGSQTLVKDVITGLFILIEDTISVGDVVDVGNGHSGVVEAISIRSIRLRDLTGTVHTVPFSQVASVMNLTKDFSFYVFDIAIAYDEDPDRVIAVVKELGAEFQQEPDFARLILEPIEILGVDKFVDSAVIIKARFKTRPIQQWVVGREFNRRLKKRFAEAGIEIPFPQRTLHIRSDTPIPPAQLLDLVGRTEDDGPPGGRAKPAS